MNERMLGVVGAAVLVMPTVAVSCRSSVLDARHCANNDGDCYCAAQHPDGSRPYCEIGEGTCVTPDTAFGCVAERPVDECYSPCGGSVLAENGECLMGESSSGSSSEGTATEASSSDSGSSESSTTGPVPCMGNEDCMGAAAPFCELGSGECVRCDGMEDPDGACAGADPGLPVCEGGMCVQCTAANPGVCTGETPVCDTATNTCVPCTAHDQCGGAACNLFNGACLPVDAVVHVGGPKPDFASIGAAMTSFGTDEEWTVVLHPGMPDYNESVTVDGGRVVAFLAAEIGPKVAPPRWSGTGDDEPQLTVAAGSMVLVDGVELSGNLSAVVPAILVNGGRAWLDRGRVVQNAGGGIVAQSNAELVLRNSRVVQNAGGGILAQSNAELTLRNCFVGTEVSNRDALIVSGAMATALYTTIVAGDGGLGQSRAVFCEMEANVTIRNSLLLAIDDGPEVECSMADVSYSATETATPGMGNATLGNLELGWLVNETNDFHLDTPPAIVGTTARWTTGDPPTDIDGDPRPTTDGTPDYAGADLPVMAAAAPEANR